jgi:hypothetical protein
MRTTIKAIFAVGVTLAAVSVQQFSGTSMADAATHPSSFAWTGTTTRSPGWELDSPNGVYRVLFQLDHNLVVYHGNRTIWSSHTEHTPDSFVLTAKGNLAVVIYCPTTPCTHPPTRGWGNGVNNSAPAHHLNMQNDGNFVEYTGATGGTPLWASNTKGK